MADTTSQSQANSQAAQNGLQRSNSISQTSENSQTAAEFINSQLQLEADAREALPYQFDTCTRPLGPLRQSLFSCLTCNPAPKKPSDTYTPAGVCYSCSISCHGEHTLVELFSKRNFVCDCGTARLPSTSPCTLRADDKTGEKGNVHSEAPATTNRYNANFRNRFCSCGEDYDPHKERGTMFQCLGLGTVEDGGCGEDWYHPECVVGLTREEWGKALEEHVKSKKTGVSNGDSAPQDEAKEKKEENPKTDNPDAPPQSGTDREADEAEEEEDDTPVPPGFPKEEDFEAFFCHKCTDAFPWIKPYARHSGFLLPVYYKQNDGSNTGNPAQDEGSTSKDESNEQSGQATELPSRKRKAEDDADRATNDGENESAPFLPKRQKSEDLTDTISSLAKEEEAKSSEKPLTACHRQSLPPAPSGKFSLFLKADFRDHICRCSSCFPLLKPHPQLLEEEDTYEPPISEDGEGENGAASVGTGSLLNRGEAAFSNMDRVRAIEGAMVYNHLKDKVKAFLQPFAESGQAVGAEDIKKYFESLRGDSEGIQQAAGGAAETSRKDGGDGGGSGGDGADSRKEQSGY